MRPSHPSAPPAARRRRLRLLLQVLGAAVLLYGGLLFVLSREGVQAALRGRIESALRGRLGGELSIGPEVHVDPLLRVTFGPVVLGGARPSDPPLARLERVKVRPRLWPLLTGRVEAASIRVYGARVELPRREGALHEVAERLRRPARKPGTASPAAAEDAAAEDARAAPVYVSGLTVAFRAAGREVEVGPVGLAVQRSGGADGSQVQVELRLPDDGRGTLDLRRDRTGWHGALSLARVSPALVTLRPPAEPARLEPAPGGGRVDAAAWRGTPAPPPLAAAWTGGTLALELSGDAPADLSRAEARVSADVRDLFVQGEALAPTPVGPLSATFSAALAWDGAERRVAVQGGKTTLLGAIPAAVGGEARLGPGLPFSFAARATAVDYAAAVAALPGALAPPAGVPIPGGTFDAHVALTGLLQAPAGWTVDAGLDLSRMREAARREPPVKLRGTFQHRPTVVDDDPPTLLVGPQSPDFVPLGELPPYVARAVTCSEDGGFFGHDGFDFAELRNAVAEGAGGKRMRGGSTITQQLAKNLYLGRSRTLARKVREAVITLALEATVPKARLLEIYLNVVEWGPGVWGIGPAARHWFGKDARALTPREAAFLASVIPNPVRFHFMWSRGATTEAWDARVDRLLGRMAEQGSLTPEELTAALAERTAFASPAAASPIEPASTEPPPPGPDDPVDDEP